jgi:hypothetical protein
MSFFYFNIKICINNAFIKEENVKFDSVISGKTTFLELHSLDTKS